MAYIDFAQAWNNSDQILLVENKELHVHRCILSMWSPVFDRMFNSDFKENQSTSVRLQGKNYDQFHELLNIIYDRRHRITEDSLESLIALADEYQMDQLKDMCIDYIRTAEKTDSNILLYLTIINRHQLTSLADCCDKIIEKTPQKKFSDIICYKQVDCDVKLYIAEKRLTYVEDLLETYKLSSKHMVDYLYRSSFHAYTKYLEEQGLDQSSYLSCDNSSQHKGHQIGQYLDITCLKCCEKSRKVREFKVKTYSLIDHMAKLKMLSQSEP